MNNDTLPLIEDWVRRLVLRSCAISWRATVLGGWWCIPRSLPLPRHRVLLLSLPTRAIIVVFTTRHCHHHCHCHCCAVLSYPFAIVCLHHPTAPSRLCTLVAARHLLLWWCMVWVLCGTGATLLCTAPGPLGPVYDGMGVLVVPSHWWAWWWWCGIVAIGGGSACGWALGNWHRVLVHSARGHWAQWTVVMGGAGCALRLLLQSHTIEVVGGWCVSVGNGAIGIVHLCAMPGSFDPVDRGRGCWWCILMAGVVVVAWCCGRW